MDAPFWLMPTSNAASSNRRSSRRSFDRFRARELFLWELAGTNAWQLLREQCQRFPKEPSTSLQLVDVFRVVIARRYDVGIPWARSLSADVDWFWRWVFPTIPERWVLPSQPTRHELDLQLGERLYWELPLWVPDEVSDDWRYAKQYEMSPDPSERHETLSFKKVDSDCFQERESASQGLTGINWAPTLLDPFREFAGYGVGLDGLLHDLRVGVHDPVTVVIHLACPHLSYTDRGKSGLEAL